MPHEPRTTRQPAVPGRNTRRPRSPRSSASASDAPTQPKTASLAAGAALQGVARRLPRGRPLKVGFTRRALVLVGILLILGLSYANSLRILLNQQRDLADVQAQVTARTAEVADLESQLLRWQDPAYVKSQARTQLGFVLPGETGYRVIGADGRVVVDATTSSGVASSGPADPTRWWDKMATSIAAADKVGEPKG